MWWHFPIPAEKVRRDWWLNAGSHCKCDLIPWNDRIQEPGSYHHPFLYFFFLEGEFFLPPSFLYFPIQCIKEWKFCFRAVLFSIFLCFLPFFSLVPLFFFSISVCLVPFLSSPSVLLTWFLLVSQLQFVTKVLGMQGSASVPQELAACISEAVLTFLFLVSFSALFSPIIFLMITTGPA